MSINETAQQQAGVALVISTLGLDGKDLDAEQQAQLEGLIATVQSGEMNSAAIQAGVSVLGDLGIDPAQSQSPIAVAPELSGNIEAQIAALRANRTAIASRSDDADLLVTGLETLLKIDPQGNRVDGVAAWATAALTSLRQTRPAPPPLPDDITPTRAAWDQATQPILAVVAATPDEEEFLDIAETDMLPVLSDLDSYPEIMGLADCMAEFSKTNPNQEAINEKFREFAIVNDLDYDRLRAFIYRATFLDSSLGLEGETLKKFDLAYFDFRAGVTGEDLDILVDAHNNREQALTILYRTYHSTTRQMRQDKMFDSPGNINGEGFYIDARFQEAAANFINTELGEQLSAPINADDITVNFLRRHPNYGDLLAQALCANTLSPREDRLTQMRVALVQTIKIIDQRRVLADSKERRIYEGQDHSRHR